MEYDTINLPFDIYAEHLEIINGIKITPREIDVIACILNGRSAKTIPSLLSISAKTVSTHLAKIRAKTGCSSRETIIDFIEKSNKLSIIKNKYYLSLLAQVFFEKQLIKISKDGSSKEALCLIIYERGLKTKDSFMHYLEKHLKLSGFKTEEQVDTEPLRSADYCLHVLSDGLNEFSYRDIKTKNPHKHFILLKGSQGNHIEVGELKLSAYIDFSSTQGNYYLSFFALLKQLFPHKNIDKMIEEFMEYCKGIDESYSMEKTGDDSENPEEASDSSYSSGSSGNEHLKSKKEQVLNLFVNPFKKMKIQIVIASLLIAASCFFFYFKNNTKPELNSIRSDLVIPSEITLLNRPELVAQIDQKFQDQRGIQSIAIVGIGGAGKTTLARQYAHQQKEHTIWEINAETQETLKLSFENLAHSLAKTEEDQKILRELLEIKNPGKRGERFLSFVKELLRASKNWLLVFDNVEKFSDIQKYFPLDVVTWGQGKVLLTTRDSNIENNRQISHVLSIGELSQDQKLNLFMQIMYHGETPSLKPTQSQEVKAFLESIPPFPLDVSIAAYYLKTTKIPYQKYLQNLESYSDDFTNVQENLLKEAGTTYLKTRYGIITLSLKEMMDTHKDFGDLLLFISLVDSQNIPRDLLDKYKNDVVVDNFIHNLRKYSLITNNSSNLALDSTFSMHRSTQAIILTYLGKKLNLENNKKLVKSIGSTFENYINELIENFNYLKTRDLISHCETFLSHDRLLSDSSKGALNIGLAGMYTMQFSPIKAQNILENALKILNKNSAKHYDKIAQALYFLGYASWDVGDFEKAKSFHEQSLVIYKKHFPKNHLGLACALINLAHVTRQLGHYEKSKNLIEESLSIYNRHYPENHIRIAFGLSFLGYAYYELGNYEKAKEILERSIYIYEKYHPQNYMGFHRIFKYFGFIHERLKDYEKAKYFLEKSIYIAKKQFPEGSYATEWALLALGNVYKGLHNYKKSRKLLENGLIFCEKHYGKDHFETAKVLRDLGQLHLLENNIKASERFLKKSLSIFQKTNHIEIYTTLESLADLCLKKAFFMEHKNDRRQSEYFRSQAIYYLKQALEIVKTGFPADSPHRKPIELKIKNLQKHPEC